MAKKKTKSGGDAFAHLEKFTSLQMVGLFLIRISGGMNIRLIWVVMQPNSILKLKLPLKFGKD